MQFMPGEWDWTKQDPFMRGGGGFGGPMGSGGFGGMTGGGGVFSTPQITGGLFGGEDPTGKRDAMMAAAAQLLSGSGASPTRRSFGELVGQAMLAGQQARAVSQDAMQKRQLQKAQIEAIHNPERKPVAVIGKDGKPVYADQRDAIGQVPYDPSSEETTKIKEYQFAKEGGYTGSYQDWLAYAGQMSRPSSVQEWDFFSKLPPAQQAAYLEMKRNPGFMVKDVNSVPTAITQRPGGNAAVNPLSTQEATNTAATANAAATAAGTATGTATGTAEGAIEKKGIAAQGVMDLVDEARTLVKIGTGSAIGRGVDAAAGWFGGSTDGANAIARLKVIQAGMMLSQPRMEGPQSDADAKLYREASASLGDPSVPAAQKDAGLDTIMRLQKKYQQAAGIAPKGGAAQGSAPAAAVEHLRKNPALKAQFQAKYGYLPDGL